MMDVDVVESGVCLEGLYITTAAKTSANNSGIPSPQLKPTAINSPRTSCGFLEGYYNITSMT